LCHLPGSILHKHGILFLLNTFLC